MKALLEEPRDTPGGSATSLRRSLSRWYNKAPHLPNALLIVVLVLAAFGRSLTHGFVWDDMGLIVDNPSVKDLSDVSQLLGRSFWAIGKNMGDSTRSFYRPLISLSYALDYTFWGLKPAGYHLTNLIWHTITALLSYGLSLVLFRRRSAALLTAVFFSIHPTHVENVCWISGRTDVLCGAFYILSLLVFLLMLESPKRKPLLLLVMAATYLAALFCKETAITLPAVALLLYVCLADRVKQHRTAILAGGLFLLVTIVYFLQRASILGEAIAPATWGTPLERVLSMPLVFAKYMGGLMTLLPLDPHHDTRFVQRVTDARFIAGVVVSGCYAVACLYALRHWERLRLLVLFLAWIPLTLAPTFKLGSFGDVLHADRFLYLPSFGFVALFALVWISPVATHILRRSPLVRSTALAACGGLVIAWTGLCAAYSSVWRDNVTLFGHATRTSPNSAYIAFNLGNSQAARGDHEEAIRAYLRAVELDPTYKEAYCNMGISLAALGRHEDAHHCYQRALQLGDTSPVLFSNVGASYRQQGKMQAAIASYSQSLAADVTAIAHNNLGECLLVTGELGAAERHFLAALQLGPQAAMYNNLAMVSIERGDYDEALARLHQATAMSHSQGLPPDLEIAMCYNFARCHLAAGDRHAAIPYAKRVIELARTRSVQEKYADVPWLRELATAPEKQ